MIITQLDSPTTLSMSRWDATVVREGADRLRWSRDGSEWTLERLWPDDRERKDLLMRIALGERLLVVLRLHEPAVPVLRDEIAEGCLLAAAGAGEEVLEIRVPPLDWLPEPLRRRGLDFLDRASRGVANLPKALIPALIVEDDARAKGAVRFVCRTGQGRVDDEQFRLVADHLSTRGSTGVIAC